MLPLALVFFVLLTAWKVSVFRDFLVRIFPHLDWIRKDSPYVSVFSPNARKYGPGKLRIRTLFTQWLVLPTSMTVPILLTAQKMKFSIKDFFNKCDQIRFLIENFFFCAVTFAILISHEDTSACNFTKSNTPPPWMIFTFSKLHKWSKSPKVRKAWHVRIAKTIWVMSMKWVKSVIFVASYITEITHKALSLNY